MNDNLLFTRLMEADHAELEAMVLALYAEDAQGEPMSREKVRRTVHELALRPDKGEVCVFRCADEIVGYAIVIKYWSNEYGGDIAAIDELYVKPQWRGRGFATQFITRLSQDASLKGLMLEVTPANGRAFAFYARLGFRPGSNQHLFWKLNAE